MITLTSDQIDQIERLLRDIPEKIPRVMYRAINRAAESARTEAGRKVRDTYYVKKKDVVDTIKIRPATLTNPAAEVVSRGHNLPLYRFQVTPRQPQPLRKNPIIVRVKRGGGGDIPGAFVARMKSGHLGIFERAGKRRLPIGKMFGPPIPIMIGNPSVREWVEQKALETMDRRLAHEITRALEGN